jgi:hypothetical protein
MNDQIFIDAISVIIESAKAKLSNNDFDAFLGRITLLLENVENFTNEHKYGFHSSELKENQN